MSNKFSISGGYDFCDVIYRTAVAMRERTSEISAGFNSLGETFKDDLYQHYASDIEDCEKQIDTICRDMGELYKELKRYTDQMAALIGMDYSNTLNTSTFYEDANDDTNKTYTNKKL